ncbi:hypothetical protein Tco_1325642 [Tanacetum coccineum]
MLSVITRYGATMADVLNSLWRKGENASNVNQNELTNADEGDQPDRPTSSSNMPASLSVDSDVSSNVAPKYQESKNQLSSFKSNESQGRDGFHVPSLVFYHSGADGDGRMSPFHSTGPTEFNGYVPMLSSQEVRLNKKYEKA